MSSTIPEELVPFLSEERTIVLPISSFSVMYFVYGIYILIFGTYIYMLKNRERGLDVNAEKLYPGLTVALFTLSTIYVVVYTIDNANISVISFNAVKTRNYQTLFDYFHYDAKGTAVFTLGLLVTVLVNIAAEWMLIHRCYVIWGCNKRIGVALILASVASNATGLLGSIMAVVGLKREKIYHQGNTLLFAYNISSSVVNSILTILTAGRIWLIHRQLQAHGVHTSDKLVRSICRIIIESGILYPFFQVASLIAVNTSDEMSLPFAAAPLITLSAGIAPTLIMVRGRFGKNVESLETRGAVSDICFHDQPEPTSIATGSQADVTLEEEGKVSV